MIADLIKYSGNKKYVFQWYEQNKDIDLCVGCSVLSIASHCPLICITFYMTECVGYTPELVQMIKSLIKFYGYKEIVGLNEGSPFFDKNNWP